MNLNIDSYEFHHKMKCKVWNLTGKRYNVAFSDTSIGQSFT